MSKALELAKACVPDHESELPLSPQGRAVLVGSAADLIQAALEEARAKAIEDCIAKVQQMHDGFLSPEYATGQPVSSITERVTCRMIQYQLRALLHDDGKARSVLDAHKEGGK